MKRLLLALALIAWPGTVYAQFPSQDVTLPTFIIPASGVTGGGTVTPAQLLCSSDGTAAAPCYSFASDPDTGMYLAGANNIGWSAGGTLKLDLTSSNLTLSSLDLRFGTDTSLTRLAADVVAPVANDAFGLDTKAFIRTDPTIASGFGTTPSIVVANGSAAFTINVGTGGTASSGVVTMPAATTGWACQVENVTGVAANRANQRTVQTATSTTSITIQNQTISTGAALAWTASDIVRALCTGY